METFYKIESYQPLPTPATKNRLNLILFRLNLRLFTRPNLNKTVFDTFNTESETIKKGNVLIPRRHTLLLKDSSIFVCINYCGQAKQCVTRLCASLELLSLDLCAGAASDWLCASRLWRAGGGGSQASPQASGPHTVWATVGSPLRPVQVDRSTSNHRQSASQILSESCVHPV